MTEFADFQNGCEKHSSGRPAEDYEFEASQRSHVLIIAPEREALTFPSMLSRLRRLSRRCVTLCREMQILRREMACLQSRQGWNSNRMEGVTPFALSAP
jgi:hypothetical protein